MEDRICEQCHESLGTMRVEGIPGQMGNSHLIRSYAPWSKTLHMFHRYMMQQTGWLNQTREMFVYVIFCDQYANKTLTKGGRNLRVFLENYTAKHRHQSSNQAHLSVIKHDRLHTDHLNEQNKCSQYCYQQIYIPVGQVFTVCMKNKWTLPWMCQFEHKFCINSFIQLKVPLKDNVR